MSYFLCHERLLLSCSRFIRDAKATRTSLKSEFAFFQSLKWLFLPTYFVNCRRTLLKLNFKGPYRSSEREITSRRCLFVFSIKREFNYVAVVRKPQRNVCQKCDARAKLLFWLLRRHPLGHSVILIFSGQKSCTRII